MIEPVNSQSHDWTPLGQEPWPGELPLARGPEGVNLTLAENVSLNRPVVGAAERVLQSGRN